MTARSSPGIVASRASWTSRGQRGRDAVGIDRLVVEPLGLQEDLMPRLVGEADDLVLDRGAIARAPALDLAGIHRRAMQIAPDQLMGRRCRRGDVAGDLRRGDPRRQKGEGLRRISPGWISSAAQSMVRPSSRGGVPVLSRPSAKPSRSRVADKPSAGASPTRPAGVVSSPIWIRPRRKVPVVSTTAPQAQDLARRRRIPRQAAILDDQILDRPGPDLQPRLLGQQRLHRLAIELPVGLGARAADGRALAPVEQPELDAGPVGRPAHHPVEGVDLPDQMALAQPADGRIAGHLADGRRVMGDQQRPRAHARRRRRRLAAGMTAADDNDVKAIHGAGI